MTSAGKSETLAKGTYRLRKAFAAVHFDQADGKGRIVILPEGAELRVTGPSSLRECYEVVFEDRCYSIFKVDLLGPRSSRIESLRTLAAERVCA